jgi:flagellar hook-length control protein FliK
MPSTPAVERAVPLSRAVATTGVMVHMMSSKGVDHARLNLKPAELGGIEVRLRSTPNGIHAHLVADSPEAARMLSSAGDDLKRQLEDKNVNLLSLDVSTSDQRQDQPAGFSTDGFGDDRYGRGQNTGRTRADESTLLMDAPAAAETTLVLPDGVHVDVLA